MPGGGRRTGEGVSPSRNGSKWITAKRRHMIYERDDWRCLYCESTRDLTLDHYRGHSNCGSNLLTCCLSCNSAKRNLNPRQWYVLLRKRLDMDQGGSREVQARIRRQLKKSAGRMKKTTF